MSPPFDHPVLSTVRLSTAKRTLNAGGTASQAPVADRASPSPVASIPEELVAEARESAALQGYEEGLARGLAKARHDSEALGLRFEQLLTSLADKRDDLLEVLEDDFVELIAEALGSLLSQTQVQRELVLDAVRKATQAHSAASELTVRVSLHDQALIAELLRDQVARLPVNVVADPAVSSGGCIVDTGHGSLDARLERLFERLSRSLIDGRRETGETDDGSST